MDPSMAGSYFINDFFPLICYNEFTLTCAEYIENRKESRFMVYPYMILADGTEIVHTQVFEEDGIQKVEVHFERPTEDGFDTARCQLPSYTWLIKEGFSEDDMELFDQMMHSNAHLFYKYGANLPEK